MYTKAAIGMGLISPDHGSIALRSYFNMSLNKPSLSLVVFFFETSYPILCHKFNNVMGRGANSLFVTFCSVTWRCVISKNEILFRKRLRRRAKPCFVSNLAMYFAASFILATSSLRPTREPNVRTQTPTCNRMLHKPDRYSERTSCTKGRAYRLSRLP